MERSKNGEPGANVSYRLKSISSNVVALIIDTISSVIVIIRFNNFAFTDRGSQTPLPYVREVEVFLYHHVSNAQEP